MYYDIGIDANIVQPQQSLSSIGIVSLSSQVSVNQAVQYMTANANSVVITSPSPVVVMTRDRILRSIRNRGKPLMFGRRRYSIPKVPVSGDKATQSWMTAVGRCCQKHIGGGSDDRLVSAKELIDGGLLALVLVFLTSPPKI